MQNFRARLHCACHCLGSSLFSSMCWAAGTFIGQALAGAAIGLTISSIAPAALIGLVAGFATMPTYVILITR